MLFDQFCSAVEKFLPGLKPIAEDAKLFIFDKTPHLVLKKHNGESYIKVMDLFALPFNITAIEDPATLIILMDTMENQVGLDTHRNYMEFAKLNSDSSAFGRSLAVREDLLAQAITDAGLDSDSAFYIMFGSLTNFIAKENALQVAGRCNMLLLGDKHGISQEINYAAMGEDAVRAATAELLPNAVTAIEELLTLNTAENFVLEERPASLKEGKPKKIPRSHQRPLFTILRPTEIRQRMKIAAPTETSTGRKSPIPHERRRHLRRLSTAGGHFKEDRIVVIPAVWIGESEKVVGNKRYKVRLDI